MMGMDCDGAACACETVARVMVASRIVSSNCACLPAKGKGSSRKDRLDV
jgi:hypothetical protein